MESENHQTHEIQRATNTLPIPVTLEVAQMISEATNGFVTLDQALAAKEIHADSYTNLLWRTVISNGWVWLKPYTNTATIQGVP
jgi:hypothetical protein